MHVGIFGGGQLGLYLCRAARALGIETTVLADERDCPAAAAADHVLVGTLDDIPAARALVNRTDVATFEIESVSPAVLAVLDELNQRGLADVAPHPQTLLTLQNKALQKQWLADHGLPTAPFTVLPGTQDGGAIDTAELTARFGLPFVQKAQRGGYDGRGVQIIRTPSMLPSLWQGPSIIEQYLVNTRELTVLVARARDGSQRCYAPVATGFDDDHHVLDVVTAPAAISADLAAEAETLAARAVELLNGVGLFAVELFHTQDETLLINEISPRVHNAGHYTMEACVTSQFEQHLRAITGMPLGSVQQRGPASMRNVLCVPGLEPLCTMSTHAIEGLSTHAAIHWYGKREARPWRKMGHITCVADDAASAAQGAQRALDALMLAAKEHAQ